MEKTEVSTDGRMSINMMGYYSALKEELMPFVTT
jgi:hypothetical protein